MACNAVMSFFTFPGVSSARSRCSRLTIWIRRLGQLLTLVDQHPQHLQLLVVRQHPQALVRTATTATACASWASVLRLWPVSNNRTRAELRWHVDPVLAIGEQPLRQGPAGAVAAFHRPGARGHVRTYVRIAVYPDLSVPNRPLANTASRSSTTSIVADSLCGSTPMNTLAMSFALPSSFLMTPGGQCYYELGSPLVSHTPARCSTGPQTGESHTHIGWAAAKESDPPSTLTESGRTPVLPGSSNSRVPGYRFWEHADSRHRRRTRRITEHSWIGDVPRPPARDARPPGSVRWLGRIHLADPRQPPAGDS